MRMGGAGAAGVGRGVMGLADVGGHEVVQDRGHVRMLAAQRFFGGQQCLLRIGEGIGILTPLPPDHGGHRQVQCQERVRRRLIFRQRRLGNLGGRLDRLLGLVPVSERGVEHRQVVPGGGDARIGLTQGIRPRVARPVEQLLGARVIAAEQAEDAQVVGGRGPAGRVVAVGLFPEFPALAGDLLGLGEPPCMIQRRQGLQMKTRGGHGRSGRQLLLAKPRRILDLLLGVGEAAGVHQGGRQLAQQHRIVLLLVLFLVRDQAEVVHGLAKATAVHGKLGLDQPRPHRVRAGRLLGLFQQPLGFIELLQAQRPERQLTRLRAVGDHLGQLPGTQRHDRRLEDRKMQIGQDQHARRKILAQRDGHVFGHHRFHSDRPRARPPCDEDDAEDPRAAQRPQAHPPQHGQADAPLAGRRHRVKLLAEVGMLGQPHPLKQHLRRFPTPRHRQEKPRRQRRQPKPHRPLLQGRQLPGRTQEQKHAGYIRRQRHARRHRRQIVPTGRIQTIVIG